MVEIFESSLPNSSSFLLGFGPSVAAPSSAPALQRQQSSPAPLVLAPTAVPPVGTFVPFTVMEPSAPVDASRAVKLTPTLASPSDPSPTVVSLAISSSLQSQATRVAPLHLSLLAPPETTARTEVNHSRQLVTVKRQGDAPSVFRRSYRRIA